MTEAAIDYGVFRHLYVALSEPVGPDAWLVRVHYKPFVAWIWGGCLLMALGGLLAATDRRYRVGAREPQAGGLRRRALKRQDNIQPPMNADIRRYRPKNDSIPSFAHRRDIQANNAVSRSTLARGRRMRNAHKLMLSFIGVHRRSSAVSFRT